MVTSFRPLFNDWDYLPLVIDDWLAPDASVLTWVAEAEPGGATLLAMAQACELEPGDWYLRGLRSNPQASRHAVGCAVLALARAVQAALSQKEVGTVRYGTLEDNHESLRLAQLLGFREHFRLAHSWHPLPEIPGPSSGVATSCPRETSTLLRHLEGSPGVRLAQGYFFTWWDTRRLGPNHVASASRQGLLYAATVNGELAGAALLWYVAWQKFVVFSLIEGSDDALLALFDAGVRAAHGMGCKAIGLAHPSLAELHRRQELFGLQQSGRDTVQLVRRPI